MAARPLVDEQIKDGRRLIDDLLQSGFGVAAAFWLQRTDTDRWNLYIVTPVVGAENVRQAFLRLHPVLYHQTQPRSINPLRVQLLGLDNPLASDVLGRLGNMPEWLWNTTRGESRFLGGRSYDDAYFYPLPVPSPV